MLQRCAGAAAASAPGLVLAHACSIEAVLPLSNPTAPNPMLQVLTTNPEAPINVECLMNDIDVSSMMTREVFEAAAKPILDRCVPTQP